MRFLRKTRFWYVVLLFNLLITGCAAVPAARQEVEVTRLVEVTREVQVTREVVVQKEVEVTREVRVTVVATKAASAGTDGSNGMVTDASDGPPESPLATTVAAVAKRPEARSCWSWQQAASHVGESGCVEAKVTSVGKSPNVFFINFSSDRNSFYAVSFDWVWEELTGECLWIEGTVTEYRGRPQIIIDDPSTEVRYCNRPDGPPAFRR